MEVIAFHFLPPEIMRRNSAGELETLSDITTRRTVQGFFGENTIPAHTNFLCDGVYPIAMEEQNLTHEPRLVMEGEKAWLELKRNPRVHAVRSHVIIDRKGNLLTARRNRFPLDVPGEGEIYGVGIARRYAGSFAVALYLCVIGSK